MKFPHRMKLHSSVTFAALVLLQRLKARFLMAHRSSGHRLFISAFIIASKVIFDDTYSNKSWSIVRQGIFQLREIYQAATSTNPFPAIAPNTSMSPIPSFGPHQASPPKSTPPPPSIPTNPASAYISPPTRHAQAVLFQCHVTNLICLSPNAHGHDRQQHQDRVVQYVSRLVDSEPGDLGFPNRKTGNVCIHPAVNASSHFVFFFPPLVIICLIFLWTIYDRTRRLSMTGD